MRPIFPYLSEISEIRPRSKTNYSMLHKYAEPRLSMQFDKAEQEHVDKGKPRLHLHSFCLIWLSGISINRGSYSLCAQKHKLEFLDSLCHWSLLSDTWDASFCLGKYSCALPFVIFRPTKLYMMCRSGSPSASNAQVWRWVWSWETPWPCFTPQLCHPHPSPQHISSNWVWSSGKALRTTCVILIQLATNKNKTLGLWSTSANSLDESQRCFLSMHHKNHRYKSQDFRGDIS